MLLTTLPRCLQTVELNNASETFSVGDYSAQMRRDYAREIAAASQMVERYINVSLQVDNFVQLLSPTYGAVLFPQYIPVRSITKLEYDPLGMFSDAMGVTTMTEGIDYNLDPDRKRIHLVVPYPVQYDPPVKQYKITMQGGYAFHTDRTVYAIASYTGTPVAGAYDQADGSRIVISSVDLVTKQVVFTPDIGTFDTDAVISCGTGGSITLGDCIEESIVNNYASLEAEVIRQVNYAYERRRSAGKHSTTSGSGVTTYVNGYEVLKSLVDACDNFQYYSVSY